MIETLEGIDRSIVLAVNGCHTPFLDEFFYLVSGKFVWIPMYVLLLVLLWKSFGWKKTLLFLGAVALMIAIVDISSVYLFKEMFQRYRPSHHALLTERLHFYTYANGEKYMGGEYGFVSSHAANFFAIAVLVGLAIREKYPAILYVLFGVAVLVSFSRIYLGVHYLSDVFVGGLWGALIAFILYRVLVKKYIFKQDETV